MQTKSTYIINFFILYHSSDSQRFTELFAHLSEIDALNSGYVINKVWLELSDFNEGTQTNIEELIAVSDIVLPLLSDNSIRSLHFTGKTIRALINNHNNNKILMLPIILDTCWWEDTIYKELEVLPRAGLPIYDTADVKQELFQQIILEINSKVQKIKAEKLQQEANFRAKLAEAESYFEHWEDQPEKLRSALPLFRETLSQWRLGFVPTKEQLETKIALCIREIDFRLFSKAAQDAYQFGDFQTAWFNCKEALSLRNDALISKIYKEVDALLKAEELKILKLPFEQHFQNAEAFFLKLDWQNAEKEYLLALEFHEEVFSPDSVHIKQKIELCRREQQREDAMQQAMTVYKQQRYTKSADILLKAIQKINFNEYEHIEHMIRLLGYLESVERFQDKAVNRWGFYDKKTNNVIISPKYLAVFDFSENLAAVKKWDKWGYIDIEGNEVISFDFDFAGHFREGRAEVIKGKETLFINHLGEIINSPETNRILALKKKIPLKMPKNEDDKTKSS